MATQYRQLYRSRTNRMIGGVCAGMGEYFGIDPTLVRVLFALGALFGWPGALLIVYLVLLVVIPEEPVASAENSTNQTMTIEAGPIEPEG